ncbi:MAG: OsmC family protein [Balneolaceae bacterium]
MADTQKKKIVHVYQDGEKYKTVLTAGDHEWIADEPESSGGKGLGPDPYDLLLMSLGTCTAVTLRMYAERKKWPVEELYLELRHYRDHAKDCEDCDDPKAKIDQIDKEIIVKGDLSEEQVQRLLEISNKCPVYRTLTGDIEIHSNIVQR